MELDWFAGDAADDSEHFTAQAFFAYQLRERGLSLGELAIAPRTLITFQRFLYAHALHCTGAVESVDWARFNRHPLAGGRWCGEEVAIVLAPVCAPAAIMYLELLAAGGVQSVIAVGAAGSLQAYAPLGAAVLPTSAIREEGTS